MDKHSELDRALQGYMNAFIGNTSMSTDQREGMKRLFYDIINSNMGTTTPHNEEMLVSDMQKRVYSMTGDKGAALRVSRLCGMLKQQDPTYNWWSILTLLSECSTSGAVGSNPPSMFSPAGSMSAGRNEATMVGIPPLHPNILGNSRSSLPARSSQPSAYIPPPQPMEPNRSSVRQQEDVEMASEGGDNETLLHRNLPTYDDVLEADLMQDLIYVMQGIDGTYVHWNPIKSAYVVRPDTHLSRPTRSMVASLSELGGLTRDIQSYIKEVDTRGRLFEQSFCTELKQEMSEYYRLVSDIESKLFKAPRQLHPGESQLGVTLRRMFSWTMEVRQKLRLMATAINKVQEGRGGGDVLSSISTMVDDGDPFIQSFAGRLLRTASTPFNSILVKWVTDGELVDPYQEFFVREQGTSGNKDMVFWTEKYTVAPDMIPVHMNREITRRIFQIGRSLNFLREACEDSEWVVSSGPRAKLLQTVGEDLSDQRRLDEFVYASSAMVNVRLMSVLTERFGLMRHVMAMRRYLLFEQGDFAEALMEVLDGQMEGSKSMGNIMAHELSAVLSNAIRSSNAQYEPSEYVDAMVLAFRDDQARGRNGWDEVSLSYSLSAPLSYVIPRRAMRQYVEISHFLVRLKRVEHLLLRVWRQHMTEARSFQRSEQLQQRRQPQGQEQQPDKAYQQAMRESAVACSEMIQFFQQIQRYVSLNIIEGAWADFIKKTEAEDTDIDAWNEAHSQYIGSIHEIVCGGGTIGGSGFQRNLSSVFDTAFHFISVIRELRSTRTLGSSRAAATSPTANQSATSVADRLLQQYRNNNNGGGSKEVQVGRVNTVVTRFKQQVRDIIRVLGHNSGGDLEVLVVTIDFNRFYSSTAAAAA